MAIDAEHLIDPSVSPFLQGAFAPVQDEVDVADLPVTGEIPAALDGVYMRNGGNPAFAPLGGYHLFDGDGMIHAVELHGGSARYRNRYVEGRGLLAEREAGQALFGGLSNWTMPTPELLEKVGIFKDTANTNIIRHAGRYLALMEGCPPKEITRDLETVGDVNWDARLIGPMTAHPKFDPSTGELLFFGYSPIPPFIHYGVIDARGDLVRQVPIDLPAGVMMHDFMVTDRRVIFFDLPAVFDPMAMMGGDNSFLSWKPENGSRIGVMDRDATSTDDVRWFDIPNCFVFHFLNGWDDGDVVHVEGCRSETLGIGFGDDDVIMEGFDADQGPMLHRWSIDLAAGTVAMDQVHDRPVDFPRVPDAVAGLPSRYGYAGQFDAAAETPRLEATVKFDRQTDSVTAHVYGRTKECGEAVFVPDPDGSAEDDGWLISFVYDHATDSSDLEIIDARDMTADAVAKIHLPQRVPFGFHGNWLAD